MGDRCCLNMWLIKLTIHLVQPGIIPCLKAQWQPSCASLELLIITLQPFQNEFPNVSSFPEKHYFTDFYNELTQLGWAKKRLCHFL